MASNTLPRNSVFSHNFFTMLLFLLFISYLQIAFASNSTSQSNSLLAYKAYIKSACNITTYPTICNKFLSPYASKIKTSPLILKKISISLALKVSRNSFSTVTNLSKLKGLTYSEKAVIRDCKEMIDDTVDELKKCFSATKSLKGSSTADEEFQWRNIKTWMSAAITDVSTCTDEFGEMKVRTSLQKKIKISVANVARMTSNALALVNNLTYYY